MSLMMIIAVHLANGFGPSLPSASVVETVVLEALNSIGLPVINEELGSAIPNPITIDIEERDSTSTCIIPTPFGCACHASAGYDASLDQISHINAVHITSFDQVTATIAGSTEFALHISGGISAPGMMAAGKAYASASACGISPSASGTASTHADAVAALSITATAVWNAADQCVKLVVTEITVDFQNVKIYDTDLDISIGPIPGVSIGSLANLVTEMIPDLTSVVQNAVQGPISEILPDAISEVLPCIAIPTDAVAAVRIRGRAPI